MDVLGELDTEQPTGHLWSPCISHGLLIFGKAFQVQKSLASQLDTTAVYIDSLSIIPIPNLNSVQSEK